MIQIKTKVEELAAKVKESQMCAESLLPKEEKLSIITLTGDRPEAFALCCRWMERQKKVTTSRPQWVVVDDGPIPIDQKLLEPLREKYVITYIEQPVKWKSGKNTQRRNLMAALDAAHGTIIAIIEDDDYYTPAYLYTYCSILVYQRMMLVGEGNALYYHLPTRSHLRMLNLATASLCQTIFRSQMIPLLRSAANSGVLYYDIAFWQAALAQGHRVTMLGNMDKCIGIKGMPGRGNITAPQPMTQNYIRDNNLAFLRSILKGDAAYYMPYTGVPDTMRDKLLQESTLQLHP